MSATLHIPVWLDLAAVATGALSGTVTVTRHRDRIDAIGVAVIAIATGLGGSMLRDIVLGQLPAALRSDRYPVVALLAAAAGMSFAPLLVRATTLLAVLDAAALGMYLALGITKAQAMGLGATAAVLVGVLACTGGGVVRDMLLGDPVGLVRVGSWYVTAALGAAGVFLLCQPRTGLTVATAATVVTAFGLRSAALRWRWSTRAVGQLHLRG
ncbi:trimeric intracellular cation channel family protein [Nocardia sp. NPDC059764]|uniref:trimeric intracellular cation channel family protein n=1 Tax=Nocardia sp. NPDC059764 TaxID=3346939 RepID=UPI003662D660